MTEEQIKQWFHQDLINGVKRKELLRLTAIEKTLQIPSQMLARFINGDKTQHRNITKHKEVLTEFIIKFGRP